MKLLRRSLAAITLILLLPAARTLLAQAPSPGTFTVGDRVEFEYVPGIDRWLSGTIREVLDDGYRYSVDIAPGQAAAEVRTTMHFRRVRRASALSAAPPPAVPLSARPIVGKYGCTESRYDATAAAYVFDTKGSLVLMSGGRYEYLGLARPSIGRYRLDAGTGRLSFSAGYLRGGEATPMAGQPDRWHLTAPAIGARWTCGRSEEPSSR